MIKLGNDGHQNLKSTIIINYPDEAGISRIWAASKPLNFLFIAVSLALFHHFVLTNTAFSSASGSSSSLWLLYSLHIQIFIEFEFFLVSRKSDLFSSVEATTVMDTAAASSFLSYQGPPRLRLLNLLKKDLFKIVERHQTFLGLFFVVNRWLEEFFQSKNCSGGKVLSCSCLQVPRTSARLSSRWENCMAWTGSLTGESV